MVGNGLQETYSSAAGAEKLQALKKDLDSVKDNVQQNISASFNVLQ